MLLGLGKKSWLQCLILCLSTMIGSVQAALLPIDATTVEAQAWSIFDPQSGQVIAQHQANERRAPASMTKMMVAYITLKDVEARRLQLNDVVTTDAIVNIVQWDESQMRLKVGEKITIDQLLAGLIIMSANDAAVTLAQRVSGNVPAFVARMNAEAKALGMNNTHFTNPAGISNPQHYSTAHDMSLLAQAVVKQTPHYLHYSKQPYFRFGAHFHRATNLALKLDPSVDGLKTGFTRAAGFNLALTAQRTTNQLEQPQRRLIVVVMGCASGRKRAQVAQKLIDLAFSYTRNEMVFKPQQVLTELSISSSNVDRLVLQNQQPIWMTSSLYSANTPIDLQNYDVMQHRVQLKQRDGAIQQIMPLSQTNTQIQVQQHQQQLKAPLQQMVHFATINMYQNNQLIHQLNVQQQVHLVHYNFFERMWNKVAQWFGWVARSDQLKLLWS